MLRLSGETLLSEVLEQAWTKVQRSHSVVWHWLRRTQCLEGFSASQSTCRAVNPIRLDPSIALTLRTTLEEDDNNDFDEPTIPTSDGVATGPGVSGNEAQASGHIENAEYFGSIVDTLGRMTV